MTHFEITIQLDTEYDLNHINSMIHAALFAYDIDPLGVTVEELDSEKVYDIADEEYEETRMFGGEAIRTPLPRQYTQSIPVGDLIQAIKENGDRYHG